MDKFHYRCGFILSQALHVEGTLDLLLAKYFCGEEHEKINLFTDEILVKMLNFSRKQNLLYEICKKEEIEIQELKEDIKFIMGTRNKVAHYERVWGGDKTELWPRKSWVDTKKEALELDDELMKEMEKRTRSALQRLTKLFGEIVYKKASSNKNL